ncbi:MAG: AAA family ATPase [Clostridia bacterium]|nr:AAA family ATPase [Clostridia bacterium]
MREVQIACAGAGKTYSISLKIAEMLKLCNEGKIIYALTYTNYAVSQIKEELTKKLNYIPNNIVIDTIHGFLLNNIIYPFSNFIKGEKINSCSIEKLSDDAKWKAKRKKDLRQYGELHSEAVTQYAKSLVCEQSSDNVKTKKRKDIIVQYIISDIFCLFVDEAQDMDGDFFDLMKVIVDKIEHFCFVGDPNQDLWGRKQYLDFIDYINNKYNIEPIFNLESRRIPQCMVSLCNMILPKNYSIKSINPSIGNIEYMYASELKKSDKEFLSQESTFSMIKSSTGVFYTQEDKTQALPYEFKKILRDQFSDYDEEAMFMTAIRYIDHEGLNKFLNEFNIKLSKSLYANVISQFKNDKKGLTHVESIHKLKGLENNTVYFFICNSLLEILLGKKNEYNKETNLLYVALTRAKTRMLLIVLDDKTMKESFKNINIDSELKNIGIQRAEGINWFERCVN